MRHHITEHQLTITCTKEERRIIRKALAGQDPTILHELDVLESLVCNSELDWVQPSETGDLTHAPMLGIRAIDSDAIESRWAYMPYQVKSFVTDLVNHGKTTWVGGPLT